jgi:hypothetical protein
MSASHTLMNGTGTLKSLLSRIRAEIISFLLFFEGINLQPGGAEIQYLPSEHLVQNNYELITSGIK